MCRKIFAVAVALAVILGSSVSSFGCEKPSAARFESSAYGMQALKSGVSVSISDIRKNAAEAGLSERESIGDYAFEFLRQNPYGLALHGFEFTKSSGSVTYTFKTYAGRDLMLECAEDVDEKADEILGKIINDGMSDYRKAQAIYRYVKNCAKYDSTAAKYISGSDWRETVDKWCYSASAYGCLVNGKCVCEGYSKAFTLLARKAGLHTLVVNGLSKSTGHQWNRVWCYDECSCSYTVYDVDCCYSIFCSTYSRWKQRSAMRYTDEASINSLIYSDLGGRPVKYSYDHTERKYITDYSVK